MFSFGKKSLADAGVFKGYTDYHSHILPGVDDGVKTIAESLSVLADYEAAGVSAVWCTPHIMEDIPNETAELRSRFEELCAAYKDDRAARESTADEIQLHLGAENMLDGVFEKRLAANDFLPVLGNKLLVETSYYNPPFNLYRLLGDIKSAGYFPIIAHPERYIYMSDKDYQALREMGVIFQLNLFSLIGFYGGAAKAKAEHLLDNSYYTLVGTDLHSEKSFLAAVESKAKAKILEKLPGK